MSLVATARDDRGVVTVTLADEANRNALSRRLLAELAAVLDDADADPAVRVVVLTNSGRVFCAGADLRESSGRRADDNPVVAKASDLFGRFRRSPKPYVGTHRGPLRGRRDGTGRGHGHLHRPRRRQVRVH